MLTTIRGKVYRSRVLRFHQLSLVVVISAIHLRHSCYSKHHTASCLCKFDKTNHHRRPLPRTSDTSYLSFYPRLCGSAVSPHVFLIGHVVYIWMGRPKFFRMCTYSLWQ